MLRSSNVPVFISRISVNKTTGQILLSAEVPIYMWPDGRKLPSYRSSRSMWRPGDEQHCSDVITTVNFIDYVMPQWQSEMPQGFERYNLYRNYEMLIRQWLLDHIQTDDPCRLQPAETESDWLIAEDFWIVTPKGHLVALGAGIPKREPQPV